MKAWWRFALAVLLVGYLAHVAIGYRTVKGLRADLLVDAAIGHSEVPAYIYPLVLQRTVSETILAKRNLAAPASDLSGVRLTLSLPLSITHLKYAADDKSGTRTRERHQAIRIARLLYDRGVKLDELDISGCSSLQVMAYSGDLEFYEFLLGFGADPDFRNEDGQVVACQKSARDILEMGPYEASKK